MLIPSIYTKFKLNYTIINQNELINPSLHSSNSFNSIMMDDEEAPSFSLGFDLDSPNQDLTTLIVPDSDSDPDTRPYPPPRRILKRLRRGLPSSSSFVRRPTEPPPPSFVVDIDVDDCDDIEEFSSQDEPVQGPSNSFFFFLFSFGFRIYFCYY